MSGEEFGTIEEFEVSFRKQPEAIGIDPMTILLMLQIAWAIWKWWRARRIASPDLDWQADEPGFEGD